MQEQHKSDWFKIAESLGEIAFAENNLAELEVNNKKICIGKFKEQLFACASKCPHAGGKLADGYVDAMGNMVCPLHRYKFNSKTGRNSSGEGYFLNTWPVEQRDDGIYVAMDNRSFF